MDSIVSICNRALQRLGMQRISSLKENTERARECSVAVESVRDALLRSHPWNFAVKRSLLAASSEKSFDGRFYYPLPADFIWLLNEYTDWKVEGKAILTSSRAPIEIRYICAVEEVSEMDVLFREVWAAALAVELADRLTGSESRKQSAREDFRELMIQARQSNAFENPPIELSEGSWVDARL